MDKNNIYAQVLRFFRTSKGLKQKEIFSKHTNKYNRIEAGSTLSVKDWLKCLEELELTPTEYLQFVNQEDNHILKIDKQFKRTCEDPTFTLNQATLIEYYKDLSSIEEKSTAEFCLYIDIKLFFCEKYQEIDPISSQDTNYFFKLYEKKIKKQTLFTYYDYRLFSNIIFVLPSYNLSKTEYIFNKMYPVTNSLDRDYSTLYVAYLAYPNLVNRLIYEKKYDKAQKYLNKAQQVYIPKNQELIHTQLKYMQHLLNYLNTNSSKEFEELQNIIIATKTIGNKELAKQMSKEINLLSTELPIETEKGSYPKIEHSIK
ncbi:Rgg family transcriptional regulator [Enterococcus faecalis]|uniref:Rgg family transcriptional regulator n=1 Tax=Enterococcus faecalis TaxID=1351 RepID=UPI002DB814BA|nr:MutR family transcriptional regulator [Enterococcus faecalis]MEB7792070.1 MutR family transcriptional regulator [Enterococcus faecalis]MEB7810058.1 MutR family transcriptional regulator [Enterococcus faecalis]